MENTQEQKTPETLKPEQMQSGKWYVVDTFLIQFEKIEEDRIYRYKSFDLECKLNFTNIRDGFLIIKNHNKIRPATKEEVLKYFPDEVFEPIELRPEDLVSGEVYTMVNTEYNRRFTFIHKHYDSDSANPILYTKMYAHNLEEFHYNSCFSLRSIKIYHATPEEKALLLDGEETTDWEAKYKELLDVIEEQKKIITMLREEPKGEKVYFYTDHNGNLKSSDDIQFVIEMSGEDYRIFEANVIGKKKSVLVNE